MFPEHAENPEWEFADRRISMLFVQRLADKTTVFNWNRGLDVPATDATAAAMKSVPASSTSRLETAPRSMLVAGPVPGVIAPPPAKVLMMPVMASIRRIVLLVCASLKSMTNTLPALPAATRLAPANEATAGPPSPLKPKPSRYVDREVATDADAPNLKRDPWTDRPRNDPLRRAIALGQFGLYSNASA